MALTLSPVTQSGNVLSFTATTSPGDRDQFESLPGTVTVDPDGPGAFQPATVDYVAKKKLPDPTPYSVTDTAGRTWTKVSDSGTVAVFNSTV